MAAVGSMDLKDDPGDIVPGTAEHRDSDLFPRCRANPPLPLPLTDHLPASSSLRAPAIAEQRAASRTGTSDPCSGLMTRQPCKANSARSRRSKPLLAAGAAVFSTSSACRQAPMCVTPVAYVSRPLAGSRASSTIVADVQCCSCRSLCASSLHQPHMCPAGTRRTAFTRHPVAAWPLPRRRAHKGAL